MIQYVVILNNLNFACVSTSSVVLIQLLYCWPLRAFHTADLRLANSDQLAHWCEFLANCQTCEVFYPHPIFHFSPTWGLWSLYEFMALCIATNARHAPLMCEYQWSRENHDPLALWLNPSCLGVTSDGEESDSTCHSFQQTEKQIDRKKRQTRKTVFSLVCPQRAA